VAWLVYGTGQLSLDPIKRPFNGLIYIVERKYFLDDLYQWTVDHVVLVFATFIGFFDRAVVNDIGVNGPADSVKRSASTLRHHVTGRVYNYALVMVLGAIGLAVAWWAMVAID
jgi:NADH-quinone oxidoreductase subunit L